MVEIENVRRVALVNLKNRQIAGLVQVRCLAKVPNEHEPGKTQLEYINMDVLVNVCYDVTVLIACRQNLSHRNIAWRNSAEEVVEILPNGSVNILKWNHRRKLTMDLLNQQFQWEFQDGSGIRAFLQAHEPRACMILNRFTQMATVMFCTRGMKQVVGVDPEELIGRSFFEFVDERDRVRVRKEVDATRRADAIHHLRFNFSSHSATGRSDVVGSDGGSSGKSDGVKCEAVLTFAWDGLVCIIRRCVI